MTTLQLYTSAWKRLIKQLTIKYSYLGLTLPIKAYRFDYVKDTSKTRQAVKNKMYKYE